MWWKYLLVFWLGAMLGYVLCALMVSVSQRRLISGDYGAGTRSQGHCYPKKMH